MGKFWDWWNRADQEAEAEVRYKIKRDVMRDLSAIAAGVATHSEESVNQPGYYIYPTPQQVALEAHEIYRELSVAADQQIDIRRKDPK